MRAARMHGPRDIRIDDVPIPTLDDPMNGAPNFDADADADADAGSAASGDGGGVTVAGIMGGGSNTINKQGLATTEGEEVGKKWKETPRAIVQVEWCGICGSDLHEYAHGKFVLSSTKVFGFLSMG